MAKSNPHNKERLNTSLLNESNAILRGLDDTRLQFVSITKVELNKDKSVATLYWDTFDSTKKEDTKKALDSSLSKIRTLLAAKLSLRAMPQLKVIYDNQYEAESHISKILDLESGRMNSSVADEDD